MLTRLSVMLRDLAWGMVYTLTLINSRPLVAAILNTLYPSLIR